MLQFDTFGASGKGKKKEPSYNHNKYSQAPRGLILEGVLVKA
jgi:hypothetical protein